MIKKIYFLITWLFKFPFVYIYAKANQKFLHFLHAYLLMIIGYRFTCVSHSRSLYYSYAYRPNDFDTVLTDFPNQINIQLIDYFFLYKINYIELSRTVLIFFIRNNAKQRINFRWYDDIQWTADMPPWPSNFHFFNSNQTVIERRKKTEFVWIN